jgi:hypothetical protein
MLAASHQRVDVIAYSLIQFQQSFGSEANCAEAVTRARWPSRFRCPCCGNSAHCVLGTDSRRLFQCNACRHQASLTAGTLLAGTKLPLTKWLLATYLISQAKTGSAALPLKRQIGVSYCFNLLFDLAWLVPHLIVDVCRAKAKPERLIRHAEFAF